MQSADIAKFQRRFLVVALIVALTALILLLLRAPAYQDYTPAAGNGLVQPAAQASVGSCANPEAAALLEGKER